MNNQLTDNRDPYFYSVEEKETQKLLKLKHDKKIFPIGSNTYKYVLNPSDIDLNEIYVIKNNHIETMIKDLINTVKKILSKRNVWFTDFKAGSDNRYHEDDEKYKVRWTPKDIFRGYVIKDKVYFHLEDVLLSKSIVKLDIIVFINDRFIEATNYIIIENENNKGQINLVNVPDDFFDVNRKIQDLKSDIEYYSSYEHFKPFKAVKRAWSLARITKDYDTLNYLKDIINSDVSRLSQINSDIETMVLFIDTQKHIPDKSFKKAIGLIKKRLSNIVEFELNYDLMYSYINKIVRCLNRKSKICKQVMRDNFEHLYDYLQQIINSFTKQFFDGSSEMSGSGLFDWIKKGVNYIKEHFTQRNHADPFLRKQLEKFGNDEIQELYVFRVPLSKHVLELINKASSGQLEKNKKTLGYDYIYHLGIFIKTAKHTFILEKNHVVQLYEDPLPAGSETKIIQFPKGLTITSLLENGAKAQGNGYYNYDAQYNNCQIFCLFTLKGIQALTPDLEHWIKQSATELLENTGIAYQLAKKIPDLASKFHHLIYGSSLFRSHMREW